MASKLPATFRKLVTTKITQRFREAVQVKEVAMPTPGPQEILVKNRFVGVNASDINYTAGRYDPSLKVPFDVGFEGIGEVVAAGDGAPIKVGQPVGYCLMGAFAEYKLVPARMAVPLPALDKSLVSMFVSGSTAAIALDKVGEIKKGETVLVTAAAGGTGQFAVQLAKLAGCHVIGTCSSEDKVQFLKSLGCDRPINYKTEDLKDVLRKEYPNGLDVVYESVGGDMFTTAVKCLSRYGRLIVIGMISSYESDGKSIPSTSRTSDLAAIPLILLGKSASVRGFFLFDYMREMPATMQRLAELYGSGKLRCVTDQGETTPQGPLVGVEDCIRGVEYLYSGKTQGKVVVELNPGSKL